jgi:hypothetical protein
MNYTYAYDESMVRRYSESDSTLTALELALLERVDELEEFVSEDVGRTCI